MLWQHRFDPLQEFWSREQIEKGIGITTCRVLVNTLPLLSEDLTSTIHGGLRPWLVGVCSQLSP